MTKGKKHRVLERVSHGEAIEKVRLSEGLTPQVMRRWLAELQMSGLRPEDISGKSVRRHIKLSVGQVNWLYHVLTNKSASEFYSEQHLWTRNLVTKLVGEWCEDSFTSSLVYELLQDFGFEFPDILTEARRSTSKTVSDWLEGPFQEVLVNARLGGARVLILDDVQLRDCFRLDVDPDNSAHSFIVRQDGAPNRKRILFVRDANKKSVHFDIVDDDPGIEKSLRFIEKLVYHFDSPSYVIVRRFSRFSGQSIRHYVRREWPVLNLVSMPAYN